MPTRMYLGHGASGSAASMGPYVTGLARRGIEAVAVDLPVRLAEDAVPIWISNVPDGPGTSVGGQSYGGRVASLAAADPARHYDALVCFSYPLHPPGSPAKAAARTSHWPAIRCPVLLISGEADPMAPIARLREAVEQLPDARLVTFPKLGHTLKPVFEEALDLAAAFLAEVGTR
ncbi:MAG TPA: alpha/beta family hydrolase [Candidatus Limnocylindrales bacterium]|nr:alpha/beta family hydrolase [Candidatus Limnocylindrales bacterium]